MQGGIPRSLGLGAGQAQAVDPRLHGAGRDRGMAGLELRLRGSRVAAGRWRERHPCARGFAERRAGLTAELLAEQLHACLGLAKCCPLVAVRCQAAHQQLLVVLVERVACHAESGQPHRFAGLALGESAEGLAAQQLLIDAGESAPFDAQPGIERGRCTEVGAFEQVAVPECRRGRVPSQLEDVDMCPRR